MHNIAVAFAPSRLVLIRRSTISHVCDVGLLK